MYKSIETLLVEIPTIRPHKMAVATMQTQTLVLVKISTEDGFVGWGEATTIGGLGYGEESPESIKTNIETYFAPLLKSLKAQNIAQTMRALKKNIYGNRFAKCAIQTALLDIQAQRLDLPLSSAISFLVSPDANTQSTGKLSRKLPPNTSERGKSKRCAWISSRAV